ncbi:hypothetical protein FACS1894169_00880 [Bacteroidia bacterium]|nr:hypothetical protein FACS1894169_00880 [Bacteroidia bacterium]
MSDFAKFYVLFNKIPYADKEEIVSTYSGGETTSLREFKKRNPRGFSWMLTDLENKVGTSPQPSPKERGQDADADKKRKYRSLILRAMQDQGVSVKGCDWSAVNAFVEKFAGKGKSLSNMSLDELKKFSRQVHKLLDYHNMKKEVACRSAIMN